MTDNLQPFDNIEERNQEILNNISQLQKEEKELYNSLDNVNLTPEEKQNMIGRINNISEMRINLYAGLKDMYETYGKNVSNSKNTLTQSIVAVNILENELNQSKKRLNLLEEQKFNKLRLVQINTYFGKRYNSYSILMKIVVITCIPILFLSVLSNKGILPLNIYKLLVLWILIVSSFFLGYQIIDISNRDDMNWDEFNWYFNKNDISTTTSSTEEDETNTTDPWQTVEPTCVGAECCNNNSVFDSINNLCVPNTNTNANTNANANANTNANENTNAPVENFEGLNIYGYNQLKLTPYNNNVYSLLAPLLKK
jgi:hypothetical protein